MSRIAEWFAMGSLGERLSSLDRKIHGAWAYEAWALECAVALALTCAEDPSTVRVESTLAGWRNEKRVTADGRLVHRQWWEEVQPHLLELQQEWGEHG